MKENWELECAYRAVRRFRVILQTASEKSFITLASNSGWLVIMTPSARCASGPPGELEHGIKGAGMQSCSISLSCERSSASGKSDAVSFLSKHQNAFALELRILFAAITLEVLGLFFDSLPFSLPPSFFLVCWQVVLLVDFWSQDQGLRHFFHCNSYLGIPVLLAD